MKGSSIRGVTLTVLCLAALGACAGGERRVASELPPRQETVVATDRLFDVASQLLQEERHREAARVYTQILERQPDNAAAKLGMAETYLASGGIKPALAAFTDLSEVGEVKVAAMQGQGLSLILLGQLERGEEVLRSVVALDPSSWRAWNALGRCYDSRKDWAKAAHSYEMALKAKPDAYAVHNNIGVSLLAQQRHSEAEAKFVDTLALKPNFETARNNLRFAIAMQGRYREAFAGAGRQDLPEVLNNVGYAAMLRGENDRAQAYFARALEASPHFFEVAHQNLQRAKGPNERTE
jgi:Flp pilus assembly protein TadD